MVDSVTPDHDKCHARVTSRVTEAREFMEMNRLVYRTVGSSRMNCFEV